MPTTVDDDDARRDNARKREMLLELTQSFYAGKWKHNQLRPVVGGIFAGSTSNPRVIEAAQSAISYLNGREICNGKNLQVVELVGVNYLFCSGKVSYLTIKASDNDFYEAEVYANSCLEHEVHFVRSAVHYPNVSPKILEYDAHDPSD